MSYHRHLGDAVTDSTSTGTPTTAVSSSTPGASTMAPEVLNAIMSHAISQSRTTQMQQIRTSAMPGGAQATVATLSPAIAAGAAAVAAACSPFASDPVAHRFCEESAQVLSGDALVKNVQSKMACDQLIRSGALDDSQRMDCVTCAMQQYATRGALDTGTLAQDTVNYEAAKAFQAGQQNASFFAKHKVAVFAAGGGVLSMLVAALILKGSRRAPAASAAPAVQKNRRRTR